MKIKQRTENEKRSKIANKDESSGNKASLKCTIFINKRQENESATTLNTKFVWMKEREKEREKDLFLT